MTLITGFSAFLSYLLQVNHLVVCYIYAIKFDHDKQFRYHNVNINVAVQTDNGLYVPVVRVSFGFLSFVLDPFVFVWNKLEKQCCFYSGCRQERII